MFGEQLWVDRERRDRFVFGTFLLMLIGAACIAITGVALTGKFSIYLALLSFFSYIMLIMFIEGLVCLPSHWHRGVLPNRFIIALLVVAVLLLTAFLLSFPTYIDHLIPIELRPYVDHIGFAYLAIMMVIGYFMVCGFGVMGILGSMMRILLLPLLMKVETLSLDGGDDVVGRATAYLLYIPKVIDPSDVEVDLPDMDASFPMEDMARSIAWDMGLACVIGIYFAFNPFILENLTASQALGMAVSAALCVPLFIVPWAVLDRMNARIVGPFRDHMLGDGLRRRVLGIVIASGTLLAFLRISFQEMSLDQIVITYSSYVMVNAIIAIIFMFIFHNYFERDIARDVSMLFIIDDEKDFEL